MESKIKYDCSKENVAQIDVTVNELVLTPLTCATLVTEIFKCLLFEKSQIPYPYHWLKSVMSRKRKNDDEQHKKVSLTVQKHFRTVSSTYDCIEDIMSNIKREFETDFANIKEVVIVLGPTPLTPKEVFTIRIPKLAVGHYESNHANAILKNQHKILRNICLSPNWLNAMEVIVPKTNTYIILKKSKLESAIVNNSFVPCKEYFVPARTKNLIINLEYEDIFHPCCTYLNVFEDDSNEQIDKSAICDNKQAETTDFQWYQATSILKGFTDCFVNKISVTELW